jgi:hypothetical protein
MPETSHLGDGRDNPEVRHEPSDVNPRAVGVFGAGLVVLAVLIHVVLAVLFAYFDDRARRAQPPRSPLAPTAAPQRLFEPRLQTAPTRELREKLAEEEKVLHSYGWVNREAGVVRIPIDRAIDLLAERGLPARPQPATSSGRPLWREP